MEEKIKGTWGGKRYEGKYKEPTKNVTLRIPVSIAEDFYIQVRILIKQLKENKENASSRENKKEV